MVDTLLVYVQEAGASKTWVPNLEIGNQQNLFSFRNRLISLTNRWRLLRHSSS